MNARSCNRPERAALPVLAMALIPTLALAHPVDVLMTGAFAGFLHPWMGLDHVAAMVAAGVWAMHTTPRAVLPVLGASAIGIIAGAWLGAHSHVLTWAETITAASAVTLGLFAATTARVRVFPAAALVALFCCFHGYVHASEAPSQFSQLAFTTGFLSSMLILQLSGVLLAAAVSSRRALARCVGACCAAAGLSALLAAG